MFSVVYRCYVLMCCAVVYRQSQLETTTICGRVRGGAFILKIDRMLYGFYDFTFCPVGLLCLNWRGSAAARVKNRTLRKDSIAAATRRSWDAAEAQCPLHANDPRAIAPPCELGRWGGVLTSWLADRLAPTRAIVSLWLPRVD